MDRIPLILLSAFLFLALYWLPGAAFFHLFEWRGLGRPAKGLLPFALSLCVAPLSLGALSVFKLSPPLVIPLSIVTALGFAVGFWLRRIGKRPVLAFRNRAGTAGPRWENPLAILCIAAVAGIAFLPRLDLLLRGSQIGSAGISDIYWHLSELTALTRSGLPPQHFLFPDVPLDYYYWSWILPSAAAGLPLLGASLMRLMNAHVLMSLLVFLALLWIFLRANIGSWRARWIAFGFLTLAGGLDFFTSPGLFPHEWWQTNTAWLVSQVQISSFLVTYMWVPQHVAGMTAFLMTLFLWRNVRGSLWTRGLLVAGCAAYLFGASVFVFLAFGLACLLWAILYRRAWMRRRAVPGLLLMAALFLLIVGPQFLIAFGQRGVVQWGGFRLNLFESLGTPSRFTASWLDQWVTWLAFPLIATVVMTIEVGLPFVLYLVFAFRNATSPSAWRRFLAVYPLLYLPFAFLLLPPNFGMRGVLPALLALNFAAALWMQDAGKAPWRQWQKAVMAYGLGITMLLQTVSPMVEWLPLARRSVADIVRPVKSLIILPVSFADGDNALIPAYTGLPDETAYIRWANDNLPADALVIEEAPLPEDNRLHLLERMRITDPNAVRRQANGQRDLTLAGGADLAGWWASLPGGTLVAKVMASDYVRIHQPPIFVVVRSGTPLSGGTLVYHDKLVQIYQIQTGP